MNTLKTAVVAGASGYIGRQLVRHFEASAITVRTIGRGRAADAQWSDEASLAAVLDGADLLVNLAGRSVSCRYTKRTADEIFASRVGTTSTLGRILARIDQPPAIWVNASTGTIYRDARDRPQDERTGELGAGCSVAVARAWEQELFSAPAAIRKVALRMAIVLGAGGGAINPITTWPAPDWVGGWVTAVSCSVGVHVDDVVRAIRDLYTHPEISGAVNVATPYPVTNAELMREVRKAWGRRFGAPSPAWLVELGARVIRTEPELVLMSRRVHPGMLLDAGFVFRYPRLPEALPQIAELTPRGLLPVALG